MLRLKLLDKGEIRALYEEHMRRDFPPSELKSLSAILNMHDKDMYDVIGGYLGNRLAAYALMYRPGDGQSVLLDYLAVLPEDRGQGVGTMYLEQLRTYYAHDVEVMLIECERPNAAPDEAGARKRIRFYTHAGAKLTQVRIWLFDVEYSILVLPCREEMAGRDWAQVMLSLYRGMLPEELYEKNVRLIRG